jgi:hypothetical protein
MTMICPDCGEMFNPLCMGQCDYHSGKCRSGEKPRIKQRPWSGKGTKQLWRQLCAANREKADLERQVAELKKALSEALGRVEVSGIVESIKVG